MSDDRPEVERAGKAALDKITEQLEWRGPNGKQMGHIVLKRELAQSIVAYIQALEAATDSEATSS